MSRCLLRSFALLPLALATLSPVALAQTEPVAVFRQVVEARNRGDLAAVMAVFADDAVRQDGSCQPICVGEAAVRRSFEDNIAEHFQATVLTAQAAGNTVTARGELRSDRFRARGAERIISDFTIELREGKIVRWSSTPDASDAQTAAYQAVLRAQAGPAPAQLPRAGKSGGPLVVAMVVGVLATGLGFGLRRRGAAKIGMSGRAHRR